MGIDVRAYRARIGGFQNRFRVGSLQGCMVLPIMRETIGALLFICILLFMAGIEVNPGPKSKDFDEATASKEDNIQQKPKSFAHKLKNFFGLRSEHTSDKKTLLRPGSTSRASEGHSNDRYRSESHTRTDEQSLSSNDDEALRYAEYGASGYSPTRKTDKKKKGKDDNSRMTANRKQFGWKPATRANSADLLNFLPDSNLLKNSKGFSSQTSLRSTDSFGLNQPAERHDRMHLEDEDEDETELKENLGDSVEGRTIHVHSKYTMFGEHNAMVFNPDQSENKSVERTLSLQDGKFKDVLSGCLLAWVADENFAENCSTHLLDLIIELETTTENKKFWESCLAGNSALDIYLQKILQQKDVFDTRFPVVKYYLERLLPKSNLGVSNKVKSIKTWLSTAYQPNSVLTSRKIISITDFVQQINTFLTNLQIQTLPKQPLKDSNLSDLNAYITSEVAVAVHRLFTFLENASDMHQCCFLSTVLIPLSYRHNSNKFEIRVTHEKLQNFVRNAEQELQRYNHFMKMSRLKLQAYLIELLIEYLKTENEEYTNQIQRDNIFKECLKHIERIFVIKINEVVSRHATERPFDLDKLSRFCKKLLRGDTDIESEVISSLDKLENALHPPLLQFHSPNILENTNMSMPKHSESILSFFGLKEHFPAKISLQKLMACRIVGDTSRDIPWIIMQKILLMDYHARDKILDEFYSSVSANSLAVCNADDKGYEDFLDDFVVEHEEQPIDKSEIKVYNPLDVFITLFCCCDYMLKQILFEKMYFCKLAIPFVYQCLSSDTLYCSFWSLRAINIDLKDKEISVITEPIKRVAFIRIQRPPYSKSKLMNTILSDNSHDTFFHKDCSNAYTSKLVSDGTVEAFWLIPNENYNEVLMFLNLRGDALSNSRQIQLLNQIINVFVVIIDVCHLQDQCSKDLLDSLYCNAASVILICTNENQVSAEIPSKYINLLKSQNRSNRTEFISTSRKGELKSESEMKKRVYSKINELLISKKASSLQDCLMDLSNCNIVNDESDSTCVLGKQLAIQVVSGEVSPIEIKHDLLPLQRDTLWGEWSKLSHKQLNTGEKLSPIEKDGIQQKMNDLRRLQIQLCKNLAPHMNIFIHTITEVGEQPNKVIYFCNWLKLILDEHSRKFLPGLNKEFQNNWDVFKKAKQASDDDTKDLLKERLLQAEKNLASATFGLEHLFREVGQIYEAIIDCNREVNERTKTLVEKLPYAVAKLVFLGQPLEIMDGDAVNVPLIWIKAVFRHLQNFIQDKRILTISVIGGQSSGKSTLLNTMFGVSFPVSAGRCTKGLFMQLLPTAKYTEKDFDYVLVIDTEGLKLFGGILDSYDLDNKFATLAIGISDITIVNVKGENVDVQEVLQIAVHGFFRLKRVNPKLKLNKHCVFLQQNVDAANAKSKVVYERQKFEEQIDFLTRQAADQENVRHITTFKQVIDFDSQKHFWYFSGFWSGEPPIAPVNPAYSKKVEEVKTCILNEIAPKRGHYFSLQDFSLQLEDLWKGILSDNFVYSFRNSLEIRAYKSLARKCHELEFDLEEFIYEEKKKVDLKLCEVDTDDLDENVFKKFEVDVDAVLQRGQQEFHQFIENHELKDLQLKWEEKAVNRLSRIKEESIESAKSDIKEAKEQQALNISQKQKKFQIKLYREANLLAEDLKQGTKNDKELKEKFQDMWVYWINQNSPQSTFRPIPIEDVVKQKLYDRFQARIPILNEELKRSPLSDPLNLQYLEGSVTLENIRQYLHSQNPMNIRRTDIMHFINQILRKVDSYLKNISKQDSKFDYTYVNKVLRIISDEVDKHDCLMSVTDISVLLSVHACRYALPVFNLINDRYEKKHGIQSYIEECKEQTYRFFQDVVRKRKEEVIAASLFCDFLNIVIKESLAEKIQHTIEKDIIMRFSCSKQDFVAFVMDELLHSERSNFSSFSNYLDDPYYFAFEKMTDYVNKELFTVTERQTSTMYTNLAKKYIDRIFRSLHLVINRVTNGIKCEKSGENIHLWIEDFCKHWEIPVLAASFQHIKERNVTDLRSFQEIVCRRLDAMKMSIIESYEKTSSSSIIWQKSTPYQNIMDKLWGCTAKCPFCYEPCENNDKNHVQLGIQHTCVQHRPPSIRGVSASMKDSKHAFDICNQLVQSNSLNFKCCDCNYECRKSGNCNGKGSKSVSHKYREYNTFLPLWNIIPSNSDSASSYWKWFLKTYSYQLKRKSGGDFPKIPAPWKELQRKDAKNSIQRTEIVLHVTSV